MRSMVRLVLVCCPILIALGCLAAPPKSKLLPLENDEPRNLQSGVVRDSLPANQPAPAATETETETPAASPPASSSNATATEIEPTEPALTPEQRKAEIERDPLHYGGPLDKDVLWGSLPSNEPLVLQIGVCQVIIPPDDSATGKEFKLEAAKVPSAINRRYIAGEGFRVITDVVDPIMHVVVTEADLPGEPEAYRLATWTDPAPIGDQGSQASRRYGTNRLSKDKRLGLIGGTYGKPTNNDDWTSALPANLRCLFVPDPDVTYFIVNYNECPKFAKP